MFLKIYFMPTRSMKNSLNSGYFSLSNRVQGTALCCVVRDLPKLFRDQECLWVSTKSTTSTCKLGLATWGWVRVRVRVWGVWVRVWITRIHSHPHPPLTYQNFDNFGRDLIAVKQPQYTGDSQMHGLLEKTILYLLRSHSTACIGSFPRCYQNTRTAR